MLRQNSPDWKLHTFSVCSGQIVSSSETEKAASMKTKIPDELKADLPPSTWGRILSATPVIMTVIATMLAGLASSEMTRAQYTRSLAAQQQAKAGDQWNFFQAKRLRGSMQQSTLDLLQSTTSVRPLDVAALRNSGSSELSTLLDSAAGNSHSSC